MIRIDDLEIDLARRLVTRGDEPVHLTRTELTLLELLVRHPGKLLTQEYLLREVWGPGYGTESNYLRVYVGQLRKKLGDDAARPRLILTEPGIGYRWIAGEGDTRRMADDAKQPITVAIVPHTHWDREWYAPFQTFRMRLVQLLDALLPMLESDLSYARFLLDGQTVVIDDYLEIRPEARGRAAAARGRGPHRHRPVDGPDGRVHGVGRDAWSATSSSASRAAPSSAA